MSPRLAAAALGLGLTLAGPVGGATAADYDADAEVWNGLGYLEVTAAEAKVELDMTDRVDLARLRPGDILVWIYPTGPLPVRQLLAFVEDGGHLVVADDRGAAGDLFEAVGIQREIAQTPRHQRWYQGHEELPILTPVREHFLFFNVDTITANHPAVLRGAGDPILTFDDPADALVVERRLGDGALLAIGDPSLFLNEMLRRFYGNKQFAANCMRLYCDRDACPVTLALPGASLHGTYRAGVGRLGRLPALLDDTARDLNETLAAVDDRLRRAPWPQTLGALALAALAVLLWALARIVRAARDTSQPPLDGGVTQAISHVQQETAGLVQGQHEADFADPARVLVRELDRIRQSPRLARVLAEAPDDRSGAPDTAHVVARNALLRIDHEADSLRESAPTVVSAERFLRLLSDVRTVCRYLDQRVNAKSRSSAVGRWGRARGAQR